MKVARVNTCLQKIEAILLEADEAVKYKESLQASPDNRLHKAIQERGVKALLSLKSRADKFKPDSYTAVATSAFRTAENGKQAAENLSKRTGIDVQVIDQAGEARLGFIAASRIANKDLRNVVVWDIGGGSMQMTSYNGPKKFDIYQGKTASASFKKHIIEDVKGKSGVETPNPIGSKDAQTALKDAKKVAQTTVPSSIKQKIHSGAEVVGIGGVHYYSVRGQTKTKSSYNGADLEKAIAKGVQKNDEQVGGEYASTEVSNLILVKGFMDELGIQKVTTGKINLADGLLLRP